MRNEQNNKQAHINKCWLDCEKAHEGIGGDFSRLSIYGDALVKLAEAYQEAGDLKSAVGIYKKARAAFYIASCIKPSCQHHVMEMEGIIRSLIKTQ